MGWPYTVLVCGGDGALSSVGYIEEGENGQCCDENNNLERER